MTGRLVLTDVTIRAGDEVLLELTRTVSPGSVVLFHGPEASAVSTVLGVLVDALTGRRRVDAARGTDGADVRPGDVRLDGEVRFDDAAPTDHTAPAVLLVTGGTGATGGALLDALLPTLDTVRVATRSDTKPVPDGTERVVLDMDDPATVRRALEDVSAAYLVTPSSERAEEQQLRFVETARREGVRHVVLLSQLGATADSPVRFLRYHAAVERALAESGMGATVLRPNLFMQGLLAMRDLVVEHGIVSAPIGDARVSAVDVRDIGAVAAVALRSPAPLGTLTLTGPEALTHAEMTDRLGRALGRDLTFVDSTPEALADAVRGALPPWQVDGLLEDYAHYARGEAAEVSDAVERVTGRPARTFDDFAATWAPAFAA
jgi:uncharacterized protein YbjT (DUF2867 family)